MHITLIGESLKNTNNKIILNIGLKTKQGVIGRPKHNINELLISLS